MPKPKVIALDSNNVDIFSDPQCSDSKSTRSQRKATKASKTVKRRMSAKVIKILLYLH